VDVVQQAQCSADPRMDGEYTAAQQQQQQQQLMRMLNSELSLDAVET